MVAKSVSMGLMGLDAFVVDVEVDLSNGLPSLDIVGLPDAAVKESKNRVRSALKNCGFAYPVKRITINLAPASKRKAGPIYDLPLLVALLKASNQFPYPIDDCVFLGELSLSGELRPVKGVLPMAISAKEAGYRRFFLPKENAQEAAVVDGLEVYPIDNMQCLIAHLCGEDIIKPAEPSLTGTEQFSQLRDFADIWGQNEAKRAMEISACGGHNALLIGPPGSGKSLIAKSMPSIMPDMTFNESIETTKIHSICGESSITSLIQTRPFRSPHHTVSSIGLAGGGQNLQPGEISMAHNGILFLDEFPEFSRDAKEVLRQPIEDGTITISRATGSLVYPCRVVIIASMNPCPCGNFGNPNKHCTCSPKIVRKYLDRISGPLLDRLDLHIDIPPVDFYSLSGDSQEEKSAAIRKRVNAARQIQNERFENTGITCNADIPNHMIRKVCKVSDNANKLLKRAFDKFQFTARAYDRILTVSRTIADMDRSEIIQAAHISEAIQYRNLDKKYWQQ